MISRDTLIRLENSRKHYEYGENHMAVISPGVIIGMLTERSSQR